MKMKSGSKKNKGVVLFAYVLIVALVTVSMLDGRVASLGTVKAAPVAPSRGDGSQNNPYVVSNEDNLKWVWTNGNANDPTYVLFEQGTTPFSISMTQDLNSRNYDIDMNGRTIDFAGGNTAVFSSYNNLNLRNGIVPTGYFDEDGLFLSGKVVCNFNLSRGYRVRKCGDLLPGSNIRVTLSSPPENYPFYDIFQISPGSAILETEGGGTDVMPGDAAYFNVTDYDVTYIAYYDDFTGRGSGNYSRLALTKKNMTETHNATLNLHKESSNSRGADVYQAGDRVTAGLPINMASGDSPLAFIIFSDDQPVYYYDYNHSQDISGLSYTIRPEDVGKKLRGVWGINFSNGYYAYSALSPTVEAAGAPPSSGGSSSSGSSSSSADPAPATVATPTAGGETKVTDSKGNAITNSLVTVKITDASGETVSKQVLTDEQGNIAKKEVVTISQEVSSTGKTTAVEKSYLAASDGTIYDTPGFTEVTDIMGLDRSDTLQQCFALFQKLRLFPFR